MSDIKATQITWHGGTVTKAEREGLLKQKGCVLWFTGLSGSGKSTLAVAVEAVLIARGHPAYVLDGDNIRFGLNSGAKILMDDRGYSEDSAKRFGLGFSADDRTENIRRIGEVGKLFADAGLISLTSFISPYRKDRDAARKACAANKAGAIPWIEIFMSTPLETCEQRDPKGLYKSARKAISEGKKAGFTGLDDPYEAPLNPELTIDAATTTTEKGAEIVIAYLTAQGLV